MAMGLHKGPNVTMISRPRDNWHPGHSPHTEYVWDMIYDVCGFTPYTLLSWSYLKCSRTSVLMLVHRR